MKEKNLWFFYQKSKKKVASIKKSLYICNVNNKFIEVLR